MKVKTVSDCRYVGIFQESYKQAVDTQIPFDAEPVELVDIECLQCGEQWNGNPLLGCTKCHTHLYTRSKRYDTPKYFESRIKPKGMNEEQYRHECEVRYWANKIVDEYSNIDLQSLYLRIKKRRGQKRADRLKQDIQKLIEDE